MQRLAFLMLAACGGTTIRNGAALPSCLIQPNTDTFSDPRPLEDWLPARAAGETTVTRAYPSGPYRISSQLLRSSQYNEADAYSALQGAAAETGVDQVMIVAEGDGERVIHAHLGLFEHRWRGHHYEGSRARAWFGFRDGVTHAIAGIGIITAKPGGEPYAGIECQDWQPGRAQLGDSDVTGAFVSRVAEGSPAAAAGLHGGELVLAWSGSLGTGNGGCTALEVFLTAQLRADPRVSLSIWQPSMGAAIPSEIAVPAAFGPLGITVGTLEHSEVQAPFVIATDQRAEHLGFRPGDLVVAVDNSPVHWRRDLHDALVSAGFPSQSRATTVSVARMGDGRWVPMTITTLPADRYQEVL